MNKSIFVIGGCRSGKSGYALKLAEKASESQRVFIATCVPQDEEMRQRVSRHQSERNDTWITVEEPLLLSEAINKKCRDANVILVDCLTLWISNLLMEYSGTGEIGEHVVKLIQVIKDSSCPVILVSNEVGTGIVPENRLARNYRDAVGFANQKIAKHSNLVVWMVAGIPVTIKS